MDLNQHPSRHSELLSTVFLNKISQPEHTFLDGDLFNWWRILFLVAILNRILSFRSRSMSGGSPAVVWPE